MSNAAASLAPASKARPGATGVEKAAYLSTGAALLFVFHYHLVPGLMAGFLAYVLLRRAESRLRGRILSHEAARLVAVSALAVLVVGLGAGVIVLLLAFLRGRVGHLHLLYQQIADVLDQARPRLQALGVSSSWLGEATEPGGVHEVVTSWFRSHAGRITQAGSLAGRFLVHGLVGLVIAVVLIFQPPSPAGPLAVALAERVRRLLHSFGAVFLAQIQISAVNTFLTGLYLFVFLPLFGHRLPLSGTLLGVTFVTGLLPVAGNLVSNTAIVVISLGVSLPVALSSLAFLVAVHKLEYFLNARIVGARVGASIWEILLAMVAMESAFGLPGLVMAPALYAYLKDELESRGLV
jgi:predicted PurR-regulated permease PerM